MRRKIGCIALIIVLFLLFLIFLYPKDREFYVKEVISPCEILLNTGEVFRINNYETFSPVFSKRNRDLASIFGLSEEEAFVIGNLGKYWAKNLLEGSKVNIYDDILVYQKYNYLIKFENSPYCIKNGNFCNEKAAEKLIKTVKSTNYELLEVNSGETFPISKNKEGLLVIRKGYKRIKPSPKIIEPDRLKFNIKDVKLILSDFTVKLKPDRNCSSDICKEILNNINSAQKTIDMAIYGYSSTPAIEDALKNAKNRGVKIRLVYDCDNKGNNIYENTNFLANLIGNSISDINSGNAGYLMHNKFFVIDNKIVITGSANLSYTDMSGFNANALAIINSEEAAKIYTREFEQMYSGKFHTAKLSNRKNENIYFSPQDKTITNGILPLIKNAKNYIYIPAFIIIERQIIEELASAKRRGVDVKIIADALNASAKHSKVKELRAAGIPVKIENYAGKLHSKTMIIDDNYLILGSMNFSYSGENRNDENLIILENPEAAKFYREFFGYLWNKIPDKWLYGFPRAESPDSEGSCSDGQDNDYDGLTDSEDDGCK